MEERSGPDSGVARVVPFGEPRRRPARASGGRKGGAPRERRPRPEGIDELLADLAALDEPVARARRRTPSARRTPDERGERGERASGAADGVEVSDLTVEFLDDRRSAEGRAARFDAAGTASGPKRRRRPEADPMVDDERIDPAERAFLLQLYKELVGGVQGPVIPFPVELVLGEDEAPELDGLADVVDLAWYRTRRALRES
jgi:hypothetical protein